MLLKRVRYNQKFRLPNDPAVYHLVMAGESQQLQRHANGESTTLVQIAPKTGKPKRWIDWDTEVEIV